MNLSFFNAYSTLLLPGLALVACLTPACAPLLDKRVSLTPVEADSHTAFSEVYDVIPFEDRNRRKFDNPVIGDLDQDGLQDVIANEHGMGMRVFWNNDNGKFTQGPTIVRGDVHGAAIADFNSDGIMDVIVTQGGGDGKNPRRPVWVEIEKDRSVSKGKIFDYFELGRGRSAKYISLPGQKRPDLVITGFPLETQKQGANQYYKNNGDGTFEFKSLMPQAKWLGYRTAVTDLNNDGRDEIIFYGGKDMVAVSIGDDGSFENITADVFSGLANLADISTISEIDFDNDGDYDLFFTRSEPQFDIESYYDADEKRFAYLSFRKDFLFDNLKVEGDLIVENLQRTYPHRELYLGASRTKVTFEGDPHGHQDLVIKPEDAQGFPVGDVIDGLYIGHLGNGIWRIAGKTRSRGAGAFRNVTSAPQPTPVAQLPAKLYENRNGKFVDVTVQMGINILEQTTGGTAADFNNDGRVDLAFIHYGSMARANVHGLLLNQGEAGFKPVEGSGIVATEVGATGGNIELFDYDADGHVDLIYSNERGKWHLMENQLDPGGKNNYVIISVGKSPKSNGTPQGAKLTLKACGVTHLRKVGATSAAFSQSMNTQLHVGLGACDKVESAHILWVNGGEENLSVKPLNRVIVAGQ